MCDIIWFVGGEDIAEEGESHDDTDEEKLLEQKENDGEEKGDAEDSSVELASAFLERASGGGPGNEGFLCLVELRCCGRHSFSIAELLVQYLRLESGQDGNALVSKTSGSNLKQVRLLYSPHF